MFANRYNKVITEKVSQFVSNIFFTQFRENEFGSQDTFIQKNFFLGGGNVFTH